jgi:hypothetical protein
VCTARAVRPGGFHPANNTLQNLLEPVAFGRTLRLHPLVVLLVTTAGTLPFGVLGATLAAPVTAVTLRTTGLLRDAGLFGAAVTPPAAAAEVRLRRTVVRPRRVLLSPISRQAGGRPAAAHPGMGVPTVPLPQPSGPALLTPEAPVRTKTLISALQTSSYCLVTPGATRIPGEYQ